MTVDADATILALSSGAPEIDPTGFVAAGARVIGRVIIGPGSSIWYNAVVRADRDTITIGARSNAQDNVSIHIDRGHPVVIGDDVSIGHNAVVHGCTIGDGSLIGMGSLVLSGAVIGAGCLIAGGAVVLEGTVIPDGSLVAGVPAKVRRALTEQERTKILGNATVYEGLATEHAAAVGSQGS